MSSRPMLSKVRRTSESSGAQLSDRSRSNYDVLKVLHGPRTWLGTSGEDTIPADPTVQRKHVVSSFEDPILLKEGNILCDLGITSLVIIAGGVQSSTPLLRIHPLPFVAICDKAEEMKQ
jgi:hypothetical protein